MKRMAFVWLDRDGSRTMHEFSDRQSADGWLCSVLGEMITSEELADSGYADDGVGRLSYYTDQGLDECGSIETYLDGQAVSPDALRE